MARQLFTILDERILALKRQRSEVTMEAWEKNEIVEAAEWFEPRYGIRLPPIWLAKEFPPTEDGRPVWGEYNVCTCGGFLDSYIHVSEQANTPILAFFHEAHHILLNKQKGQWVEGTKEVEETIKERAKRDLIAFYERDRLVYGKSWT